MSRASLLHDQTISQVGGVSIVFVPGKTRDLLDNLFLGVNDEYYLPLRDLIVMLGDLHPDVAAFGRHACVALRDLAMRTGVRESTLYPTGGGVH